ncbi:DNA polymerase I [Cytophagales bacterium LB-30]|uniref:DNA polymerase I n=1 Tax=Shiella aurantiaca TaxID=3058365 RepID=A0ABT8F5H7_9BACT|nr:DNA polymerase I [Shiella aurantiaca]MDN4165638.1 DNA polymerase I [Shiella aurantiaca]
MSKPTKKLFLLDAMALIYRAHFALSKTPLINSKGQSTGAVRGFTNSLIEILKKQKPTHLGVAFDLPGPTFRHEAFTEYKAQRQEQPEDITFAIPYVKEIVRAYNLPVLEMPGYEADDVIGTFAWKAADQGFEVYMMTPDKDYSQLVREHVYLYKPAYMGNAVDILGVPEVLAKWEIDRVDQVADILGLQGDAVDNIPGIPGIGAKTAVKLIKEYGSVENLIAHADELKGKMQENVKNFAEQGILSKQLAIINTEVPLEFDENALLVEEPNREKLKEIFEVLEFRTLAKQVLGDTGSSEPSADAKGQLGLFGAAEPALSRTPVKESEEENSAPPQEKKTIYTTEHEYHVVDTLARCQELVEYLQQQSQICFDTETTSLDAVDAQLVGLSFAYLPGEAFYIPIPADQAEVQKWVDIFKPVWENAAIRKVGQNIKYDILVLKKYGVEVMGEILDTMVVHYLIDPETRHGMDILAENYLNYKPVSITELIGKKGDKQGNMREVAIPLIAEYASEDADITLQLQQKLESELKDKIRTLYDTVEGPLIRVLADMEYEGIRVDPDTLKELSEELEKDSRQAEKEIFEIAGQEFNIASPKQLGEILFDKLKLIDKPKKTKTGQYATGEEILSKLAHEHAIANKILDFREYQKLKSTYVDALALLMSPSDGRIHTSFNQTVAATGRLSSTNPNLQNIPIRTEKGRAIRKAFVPRNEDFTLMSADYSQIELRIMADFAKDETMIKALRDKTDIHSMTAAKVFGVPVDQVDSDMRRKAKAVNFGIIYGTSAFGLAENLNISRTEASEIIKAYFTQFSAVKECMDELIRKAKDYGYAETILGRKRFLPDIYSSNMTMRNHAERNAINAPIQGSAADMIKVAMIKIHDWMKKEKLKSRMILQVHDELVFDAHHSETELLKARVEELMATALPLSVPMEIGIGFGDNWLQAH